MKSSPANYVRIFDTSLRDGEQAPGASMTSAEKLEVARALARLGVDVIEAGFPAASPDDLAAVQAIAAEIGQAPIEGRPQSQPPIICGLARCTKNDIDAAWEGVKGAKHPRIHTFLATSDLHLKHKLRMSREEMTAKAVEMVAYARTLCKDVEFSPEDAGRSDPQFLYKVLAAVIKAGATTLNIPDTVGYTMPDEFGELIAGIIKHTPGAKDVVISVHCHDDLGLAVANSLAGLRAGARQAEVTVNGIGERAGNASLEEVVMAIRTRGAKIGLQTGIDATQLCRISKLVSRSTSYPVPPNKAIVGANAFAHESGIHQDGVLKNAQTYEIMTPASVGIKETTLVMGKHSGRAAFKDKLKELGYELGDNAFQEAFQRFKDLADRKKHVYDADIIALVDDEAGSVDDRIKLVDMEVISKTGGIHRCELKLAIDGVEVEAKYDGTGSVDAIFNAIKQAVGKDPHLVLYAIDGVTGGTDAQASAHVRLEMGGRIVSGNAAEPDTLVASARAYINAYNRLLLERGASAQGALAG